MAWTPSPGGKDCWIPTRTQALGSEFRVSGQTDASPPWRALRLGADHRSGGHELRLRLGRVGWLAVATAEDAALPERWPSRGRHGRHLGGQAQMAQVAGDVFGVLDERDELHLSPATIVRRLAIYLAPSRAKRRATPSAKTCSCTIRLSTRVAPMAKSKK